MIKYILAAVVVLAAWSAWLFLLPGDLWWIPLLVTIIVGAVLASIWLVRRLRARRAARDLEKALAAQAAEQARTARPDMQADILHMQQEFQRAIAALKSSKLARGGENALYALPWNLIVGPPGAGKSTALRNSGLQFPYMSTSGGGVRGIGGTRNCDWWLTNEGVLLDTAGRWTTEDEDQDDWYGFLDLIKKYRPEKPLNGIIAAVPLDQLGGAHEEEISALARRTRERIDEVQSRLQMSLPVYVMFTKSDLVPGFVETFTDLSKQERGQVWGFTVALADPPADPGVHFAERFDELSGVVEKRAMRRMGEERKLESRELIHGFPQQLGSLKRNCELLVGQLFEPSVFGETPMFRGCYFTSGTQEGRPIDRVMHKMAEAFGLRSEVHIGEPTTEAKSYFLRDVFLNVVFPDRDVATRSAAEHQRQRRNQYAAAGAIFATALLISTLPALAWAKNRDFLEASRTDVDRVAAAARDEGPLMPEELRPLRERIEQLDTYAKAQPVMMSMGMYQEEVYPAVSRYYSDLLQQEVVGPIVESDERAMDDFGRRYQELPNAIPSGPEHAEMYDRLKMHLLLTRPRSEGEPQVGDAEIADWLADHITRRWVAATGGEDEVGEATREEMRAHAEEFARQLSRQGEAIADDPGQVSEDEQLRFPRDDQTVQRTRRALTRVSLTDMALDRIIQEMEPMGYELTLASLVGNTVPPMRSDGQVRGAFTRRAWDHRVREMLETTAGGAFGESWVLGREAEIAQRSQQQQQEDLRVLRNQFFRAYVEEWRDFLRSIRVIPPRGNNNTLVALQHLTRGNPEPYRLLFQQVLYNTLLPVPEEEQDESEEGAAVTETGWDLFWRRVRRVRGGQNVARILGGGDGDAAAGTGRDREDLTPEHVYLAFEGFTRFGAVPPPASPEEGPEEGREPPPPPELPVGTYEEQLRSVRDALQAHLDTPQGTEEALQTSLQAARTTTRGLIEGQEIGWRPRLEALLWPPIEGAAGSVAIEQASSAGRSWCSEVYMPYRRNILGGYPLNPSGHDVPLTDFGAFYAPNEGTLWSFYDEVLQRRVPKEGDSFVFAQNLGQHASNAYRRQLVQYLERANDVTNVFFPPGADGPQVQFDARILPSPRVATTELCVGGVCNEHHNGPERWFRYTWPGDSPEAGAALDVRGVDTMHERLEQGGEWGLFRLLEQGTVTETSSGNRVFTITWRLRDHQVDIPIQIRPVRGDAPFFGVRGRTRNPSFLAPLRGTQADPPQQIVNGRNTCRAS